MASRLALLALVLMTTAAPAQTLPDGLLPGPRDEVVEVIDGDTVVLAGGREVRLVGIMAPKLALGRAGMEDEPLAREARDALAALVLERTVELAFGTSRGDRHGRLLAHLVLDDGTWVQGRLLADGLARVYTFADNRVGAAAMLALEAEAREARRGIWTLPFYAVRDAAEPFAVPLDRYVIVEGIVLEAAEVDRRVYLNFGEDWKSDVTATISPRDRRNFTAAAFDPMTLQGRRVRIRGWTGLYNGPNIDIDHPEQIEVLEQP